MPEVLTSVELEDALRKIETLDEVEDFELFGISVGAPSDYEPFIAVVHGSDESRACSALCGLFYGAGAIGIGARIGRAIVGNPASPRADIGSPILARSIIECGDVTAFHALMEATAPPWEGAILRAQALVRSSFPDAVEFASLSRGGLFAHGIYIREQLAEKRFITAEKGRLLWYLKAFAGDPEVDEIFERELSTVNGEIAAIALVGFAKHVLSIDQLRKIPISRESALIRVANMAAKLYRDTGLSPYIDFIHALSRSAPQRDRLQLLVLASWAAS